MRSIAEIDQTLLALNTLFDAGLKTGCSTKTLNYYCKLALIELCGWVEQAMDELILASAARSAIAGHGEIKIRVDKTYSFDYGEAFRPLLLLLVGYKQCEAIESKLNGAPLSAFQTMKSLLSTLRPHRNAHAHTHLESSMNQIMAPSSTRAHLKNIEKGLIEIEMELISLGY
ncbi:hypothetical protein V2K98_12035 [Pseudomonas alliivorans]|nr:hypothetical protein [Pseudomonas alliivorans]MEE4649449.1 hypothetical protein [Pseudomonas alliivorans]